MKTDFISSYEAYLALARASNSLWECRRLMIPKYLKHRLKLAEQHPTLHERIINKLNE